VAQVSKFGSGTFCDTRRKEAFKRTPPEQEIFKYSLLYSLKAEQQLSPPVSSAN
jgi:hypothetical protein